MSMSSQSETGDELGPIDFLAVEFPGAHIPAPGFEHLLSLAGQGVIAILDLEFITRDGAGNARKVDVADLPNPDGVDLSAWAGASSGLLDGTDIEQIGVEIAPGSVAAVIVYENRWAVNLVNIWRRDGARFIAGGGLALDDVMAALDEAEA